MLGSNAEFQKCPSTCQDSVSDPILFCWTILVGYCSWIKTFFPLLKNDVSAYWIPSDRKKGGCCGPDMLKNKLQIPETHKKTGFNVHTSFQVLYPSAIVIRDVLLRPLLFQPHCCVRSHQSWRCTACSSSTIMDKEDVTSRTKHSATEISCWCNACFSSQYKMSVLAWVMITGMKAEGILNKRKQMNDGCFRQASDGKSRWALWCGGRLPPSGHIPHSRLQVAITTPKTCQVTIQWWRHTAPATSKRKGVQNSFHIQSRKYSITVIMAAGLKNTALLQTSNRWQSLSNLQPLNSASVSLGQVIYFKFWIHPHKMTNLQVNYAHAQLHFTCYNY